MARAPKATILGHFVELDDPLTDSATHAGMKHLERVSRFDLPSEGQHYRVAGLNLVATIVICWNTAHLGESGQTAETRRPDRRARAPSLHLTA